MAKLTLLMVKPKTRQLPSCLYCPVTVLLQWHIIVCMYVGLMVRLHADGGAIAAHRSDVIDRMPRPDSGRPRNCLQEFSRVAITYVEATL
jgi:hypothetical protein